MAESGCQNNPSAYNLHVSNNLHVDNDLVVTGSTTLTGGLAGALTGVTESAATTAIDLTSTSSDHILYLTGAHSDVVKLPLATASNVGITIKLFYANDTDPDGTGVIAVAQSGSTTFLGSIVTCLTRGVAGKEATAIKIDAGTKKLVLDSNLETAAGGAVGSHYSFHYIAANKIFVTGVGLVGGTTATAPDPAVAFSGTGWS